MYNWKFNIKLPLYKEGGEASNYVCVYSRKNQNITDLKKMSRWIINVSLTFIYVCLYIYDVINKAIFLTMDLI